MPRKSPRVIATTLTNRWRSVPSRSRATYWKGQCEF